MGVLRESTPRAELRSREGDGSANRGASCGAARSGGERRLRTKPATHAQRPRISARTDNRATPGACLLLILMASHTSGSFVYYSPFNTRCATLWCNKASNRSSFLLVSAAADSTTPLLRNIRARLYLLSPCISLSMCSRYWRAGGALSSFLPALFRYFPFFFCRTPRMYAPLGKVAFSTLSFSDSRWPH